MLRWRGRICRLLPRSRWSGLTPPDRPQPRLDRMRGNGMAATVGRLRPCGLLDWKFTVLSHNTIRGAAGAALLNAELLVALGKLDPSLAHATAGTSRMRLVVMKFGGTSVEDGAAIDRTAKIVAGRIARGTAAHRGGERDGQGDGPAALCGQCRCAWRPRRGSGHQRATALPASRHGVGAAAAATRLPSITIWMDVRFDALDEVLRGLAAVGELTPRITDLVASYGERLSSKLVAAAFAARGIRAAHVDAREIIITDAQYGKAVPNR